MSASAHSAPVLIIDNKPMPLVRLSSKGGQDASSFSELKLQRLVHEHPALVPMAEIEPAFSPLIPICMELPNIAGSVDNLWITPSGGIVLGECKLVSNPEARRKVVAQVLDYAQALTGLAYMDLEAAVKKARKADDGLWDLVKASTPPGDSLEEAQFVDAVSKNLGRGAFLCLIIGDGILQSVENLVEQLQLHAGLHIGMALVELTRWRCPDGSILVVSRVPMKTKIIERGIVRIDDAGRARIEPAKNAAPSVTMSEEIFFEQLEKGRGVQAAQKLRNLLAELQPFGISTAPNGKSLSLRWQAEGNEPAKFATVEAAGYVWSGSALSIASKLGAREAAKAYLADVAEVIGGQVKTYEGGSCEVLTSSGKSVLIDDLIDRETVAGKNWRLAIERLATDAVEQMKASDQIDA